LKSLHEILNELRLAATDQRDKGTLFELLAKSWLETAPEYADLFDKVWSFSDWAKDNGKPQNDTGVDLVARQASDGKLVAIQCKFYAENHVMDMKNFGTFFTTLNKEHFDSGIIFSTTDRWSKNADEALEGTSKPVVRIGLHAMEDSGVDWNAFSLAKPQELELVAKKTPFPHQNEAIGEALKHFNENSRGKLIMACGTGKTYTSLKIAEKLVPNGGTMLFLVPSIALLSQSLKEWKREATRPITAYAVCSDSKIGRRRDSEDIQVADLAYPATTDTNKLATHFTSNKAVDNGFTVIFSTYQSLSVVANAQAAGVPEFDLVICDEAHRTTGVTESGDEESSFVKIHDDSFLRASKRLYMTATPRIYLEQSKQKALEMDADVASMDDPTKYGEEFYRLNFGEAVSKNLLSDYKVLVLAVSEDHVSKQLQKLLTKDGELNLDDATKIVGCYNGLRKRSSNPVDFSVDSSPMKSAVAFTRSINDSKKFAEMFTTVVATLNAEANETDALVAEADHVDGTYNMEERSKLLDWLKQSTSENTVRILSNARCLSEGVDVPSLDAVLFLNPRESQVDVVQSVGRVMRKSKGKDYGYVILPITVPIGKTAEEALSDNNRYKVVWQVLQALRSHDERFDAMINKIEINGATDDRIKIIGVGGEGESGEGNSAESESGAFTLDFPIGEWQEAITAKIVQKVGQRGYWENWAQDVAGIAQDHISRIKTLVGTSSKELKSDFQRFVKGLQDNLNPEVDENQAVEMLAQHLITKPVFDALFDNYAFSELNPVSRVMQKMVDALEKENFNSERDKLEKFYDSVKIRAEGITDGAGKQQIVKDLYEKFFKIAFSKTSDRLGIVYTPNEVVDFMLRSVNAELEMSFNTSLGKRGVQVLDPFTGTGTYLVRLLQSGLIDREELAYKYKHELHANELVLLAYYVAAINIEETFHDLTGSDYVPFDGMVLTDTFQMHEDDDQLDGSGVFAENNDRVVSQKALPIRVIIGNPPYSAWQDSANSDSANASYPHLDARITETYAAESSAQLKNSLYDSYIRAIRWASDRLQDEGIICFVTNNGFLDGFTASGLRKTLLKEFSSVAVMDLRGNSGIGGEVARKEGGNVFPIRVGVSLLMLVRKRGAPNAKQVSYYATPDYTTKEQKLELLRGTNAYADLPFEQIEPNAEGDWLNQRTKQFSDFVPLNLVKGETGTSPILNLSGHGLKTNRDAWVYNYSKSKIVSNVKKLIAEFNSQVESGKNEKTIDLDSKKISWSSGLIARLGRGKRLEYDDLAIRQAIYRPFSKTWVYFDKSLNERTSCLGEAFPPGTEKGEGFFTTAPGSGHQFAALALGELPDHSLWGSGGGKFFPRYVFESEQNSADQMALFDGGGGRQTNVFSSATDMFTNKYGKPVSADEVYFYVYGVLHSSEYRQKFQADLQKSLPRIPFLKDFDGFSQIGQKLYELHRDYELLDPYPLDVTSSSDTFSVTKMKFGKGQEKNTLDKSVITVNSTCTISGIPLQTHEYVLSSRTALEWVLERYQVKTDKDSTIVNDPNDWVETAVNPKYIVDLIGKVVRVSVETIELMGHLPKFELLK
jgi:predicted helicase